MADRLRQLYHRYDWCEYFQLKIEFSGSEPAYVDSNVTALLLYRRTADSSTPSTTVVFSSMVPRHSFFSWASDFKEQNGSRFARTVPTEKIPFFAKNIRNSGPVK